MNCPEWLTIKCLTSPLPDAIFFVPVAAEFDENTVSHVMTHIAKRYNDFSDEISYPLVCCDVQGFLRTFEHSSTADNELAVVSHSSFTLRKKLLTLSRHVFLLKADLNEANAVLRDEASSEQVFSPHECVKRLHKLFAFQVICITMGPQGCLVSCKHKNGQISIRSTVDEEYNNYNAHQYEIMTEYVPAFKPKCTVDETGCGDTFLSCLIAEMLIQMKEHKKQSGCREKTLNTDQLFQAVKMAASATSFVVECVGPHGFATRAMAAERVRQGEILKFDI